MKIDGVYMVRNKEISKKKIKNIAILTPTFYEFSGIDRMVEMQAEDYYKKGYKVKIFCLDATFKPKHAEIEILGIPKKKLFQSIYKLIFPLDFKKNFRVIRELKNYDCAISHYYPMNFPAYIAKKIYGKKIKYVYYNYGINYPELFPKLSERVFLRIFRFLANATIRNVDEAVSISYFLKGELKKETGIISQVEHCKINTKRFHLGINGSKIRKKYKINNEPLLLFVGRISPHKGVHLLIEAFKLLRKKVPNAKLIIVGKHSFDDYSKKLKDSAGRNVIFAGAVKDEEMAHYYAACDVYTTATLWEGYDLPIAEAQACGKPVVAFKLCSHPEVIDKKGILVEPKNTKAFADAVMKILKKERKI